MKLSAYVNGRDVATFESQGDFESVLTYHADVSNSKFVSLTMPVRTKSYTWHDPLHPIFQMNLPEGYLLQVLQEQLGPQIGASPIALLSVVGRNMVGRLKVAAAGANLNEPLPHLEVAELLQGDNSEKAFTQLVRQYATSGVSGVIPKFLDAQKKTEFANNKKVSMLTRNHIIKGSSEALPFLALNEHLCMMVSGLVLPAAKTEVSTDGRAIVVHRFDTDNNGQPYLGLEDFCALLGLRPSAKYETTWERIAKAVLAHVSGKNRSQAFKQLAINLLLTYALQNADCHSKNIALLYSSHSDVHLAPTYDMVTTSVYAGYHLNPPAISFMGKKTWLPGKHLQNFISTTFGIKLKIQKEIIELISDAISEVAGAVHVHMKDKSEFREIGKRMLLAWHEGITNLRSSRSYAMKSWQDNDNFIDFSDPDKLKSKRIVIGHSEGLGQKNQKGKHT